MSAVLKFLTGAAAVAAISVGAAAPAAAQYYPGTGGYGGGGLGDVLVGAVLNNILRGGNPGHNSYYGRNDYNSERAAVNQCARAAEQRINSRYANGNNQRYGQYGYDQASQYRVVQIDRVQRTRNGNMRVNGQAANTAYQGNYGGYNQPYGGYNQPYGGYNQPYGGYNQPYGGNPQAAVAPVQFSCKYDRNGRISDLKVSQNRYARGY